MKIKISECCKKLVENLGPDHDFKAFELKLDINSNGTDAEVFLSPREKWLEMIHCPFCGEKIRIKEV